MKDLSSKKVNAREIKLKIAMLKSGVKGKDIAEVAHVSNGLVSMWIKGTRSPEKVTKAFEDLTKKK